MASNQFSRSRSNGRTDISNDRNLEKGGGPHEPATQGGRGRPPVLDIPNSSFRPGLKGSPRANGINSPTDYTWLEFGSLGPVSLGNTPSLENGNSHSQGGSGLSNAASMEQRPAIYSIRER